ncbi:hypothetical protein FF011L_40470 [Roseimaritima multifibrata]|uniref:Uncharacterized protein n=1 Tax=Roseimaritima multifibrata TaxID=1930274 RepID=A0A517MK60_9BACT|nr:hypothetical protein [Roseimaritima multifibrata]QDS95254.1 hypothetical protein FF011L_40470 [Roseimaritima multifibrata]
MGRVTETVATVNSAIRTVLASVVLFFLGGTGWVVYDKVTRDEQELNMARSQLANVQVELDGAQQQIVGLEENLEDAAEKIVQLETSMNLLKTNQRLAQLDVLDQQTEENGDLTTKVRFSELSPEGEIVGEPREFTIQGDVIYLDNWIVKFEDRFVEEAHLQRGTSLVLFRRIFGEQQKPIDGFELDEIGRMPQAYARGGVPSDFEKEIWDDFWTIANDSKMAKEKGIRAAHGEAVSIKTEAGRSYRILLRASDGLSIVPITP